jgi:hypothetical protein
LTGVHNRFEIFIKYQSLVLLILGVLLLIARNSGGFMYPTIYTEDGSWIGYAWSEGWGSALIDAKRISYEGYSADAKNSYFVVGNLLMIWGASISSKLICGNELVCLPQSISLVSMLFYSSVATLAFVVTKDVIPKFFALLTYLMLLLIPIGNSSSELIGRLSNVGFSFVLIACFLMFIRAKSRNGFFLDFGLILCALTNPVCLVQIPVLSAFFAMTNRLNFEQWLKRYWLVNVSSVLVLFAIGLRLMESNGGVQTGALNMNSLIEVVFARSLLYPFIFPFYESLTNFYTLLLLFGITSVAILLGMLSRRDNNYYQLIASLFASLLIFLAATIVMRPSLTQQLTDYTTTFPDRYFFSLNGIVVVSVIVILGRAFLMKGKTKLLASVSTFALLATYALNLGFIFEGKEPRMVLAQYGSLNYSLCNYSGQSFSDKVLVYLPTEPDGWFMKVPGNILDEAIRKTNCLNHEKPGRAFVTDENWHNGFSKVWAGFYLPASLRNSNLYKVGRLVQLKSGVVRRIESVAVAGQFLHIQLEGQLLEIGQERSPQNLPVLTIKEKTV